MNGNLMWIYAPYKNVELRAQVPENLATEISKLWQNYHSPVNDEIEGVLDLIEIWEKQKSSVNGDFILVLDSLKKQAIHSISRSPFSNYQPTSRFQLAYKELLKQKKYSSQPAIMKLAQEKKVGIVLSFAGNANDYFSELKELWEKYPIVQRFLEKSERVLESETETRQALKCGYLRQGMSFLTWLQDEEKKPDSAYLSSSAVSQPLTFLTQMSRYFSLSSHGFAIDNPTSWVKSLVGHSQGIMSALLISLGLSEEELLEKAADTSAYLLWQGIRCQESVGILSCSRDIAKKAEEETGGAPSPMAVIGGFTAQEIEQLKTQYIQTQGACSWELSLHNGPLKKVISGFPQELESFRYFLEKRFSDKNSLPRQDFTFNYLPASAPFHSSLMNKAAPRLLEDLKRINWSVSRSELRLPVFSTETGEDIREANDLVNEVVRLQVLAPVDWQKTLSSINSSTGYSHIVDLGPGEDIARLSRFVIEGCGVKVIAASNPRDLSALVSQKNESIPWAQDWSEFAPTTQEKNGREYLSNRFTNWCGRSPIILPGMTPTTVTSNIVAVTANAGFVAELAGGGQVTEEIFRKRMDELREKLEPGQGVVINTLYLDPYLWDLQIKKQGLIFQLKKEGYPIIGVTISAGIPEVREATELIKKLCGAGIFLNAFKPGTPKQIAEVLSIADALEEYPLCMQVEGGLAGGHHGWYDLHRVLVQNYYKIRQRKNLFVLAGGGIREEKDVVEFLTGEWSTARYAMPKMPLDGAFIGTLAMACRESEASLSCKEALLKTEGTKSWQEWITPGQIKGEMTTGKSPLDADIYYIENTTAKLGRLLDKVAGNAKAVAQEKESILNLMNQTAKPFFGDLTEMSYLAVLQRMADLMARGEKGIYEDGVWIDKTYRSRFALMVKRTLERFSLEETIIVASEYNTPSSLLAKIATASELVDVLPLSAFDQEYFIYTICQSPGKPVNFVPIIDESIRKWYKSDSLHFCNSELYSADEVFQTPGPRAVSGIDRINEPITELFGRFHKAVIDASEKIAPFPKKERESVEQSLKSIDFSSSNICLEETLSCFSGHLVRLIKAPCLSRGKISFPNYIPSLVQSGQGKTLLCLEENGELKKLTLKEDRDLLSLEIFEENQIYLTIYHSLPTEEGRIVPLEIPFSCQPDFYPPYDFSEQEEERKENIISFYEDLLFLDDSNKKQEFSPKSQEEKRVTKNDIKEYLQAVAPGSTPQDKITPPLSMAFVVAWKPIFRTLLSPSARGDFFSLVHLSNAVEQVHPFLGQEHSYQVEAVLHQVKTEPEGKTVVVRACIKDEKTLYAKVESAFLFREKSSLSQEESFVSLWEEPTRAEEISLDTPYTFSKNTTHIPNETLFYALASGDYNPIHRDSIIASWIGFSEPIVHGMWLKANALRTVEEHLGILGEQKVQKMEVNFSSPAFPGEKITTQTRHIAMQEGRLVLEVTSLVERKGEKLPVLTGKIYLKAPRTALVFPGQGVQVTGMGSKLRQESRLVREVWTQADIFTRQSLGFSLLEIVEKNPKKIYVRGEKWVHQEGVLFLTQFTQVALVVHGIATLTDLKKRSLFSKDMMFGGHSLGEYSSLAACANIISLEKMIEVVYQRGLTMQNFVPRNEEGISPYGMGVICPHRANLSEEKAFALVAEVAEKTQLPLEIVNHNVRGRQYSVAGDLKALQLLKVRLGEFSTSEKKAYMPVPGVDVPFHSSLLKTGVDHFRRVLNKTFTSDQEYKNLDGRYLPNLVARPFSLEKSFLEETYQVTESIVVKEILAQLPLASEKEEKCRRLLLIELLAYQFAFPVRWIETQDLFLDSLSGIDRLVEVGVETQPTLSSMLQQTMHFSSQGRKDIEVVHAERDYEQICFLATPEWEDEETVVEKTSSPTAEIVSEPKLSSPPKAEQKTFSPAPTGSKIDIPSSTKHAVKTILSLQAKLWPEEIEAEETVDQLLGGNSSRRNQVLVDLWNEFNIAPMDSAHEIPIQELIASIEKNTKNRYQQPGPYLRVSHQEAIKKMFGATNFTVKDIFAYYQENWDIPEECVHQILSYLALSHFLDTSNRSGQSFAVAKTSFGQRKEVEVFLEQLLDHYQQIHRVSFSSQETASVSSAVEKDALDKALARYFGAQGAFVQVARFLEEALGHDPYASLLEKDREALEDSNSGQNWQKEHGPSYTRAIRPVFNVEKIRSFHSAWNWIRRDIVHLYWKLERGNLSEEDWNTLSASLQVRLSSQAKKLLLSLREKFVQKDKVELLKKWDQLCQGEELSSGLCFTPSAPSISQDDRGFWHYQEIPRLEEKNALDFIQGDLGLSLQAHHKEETPEIRGVWQTVLKEQVTKNLSFQGKVALVTGASPHSIALAVVENLLRGGARVIVTTTNPNPSRLKFYREVYQKCASEGAQLHVIPFNQGSQQDIENLIRWIYQPGREACGREKAPWQLDYLIPFGATQEENSLAHLDDSSMATLRVMLFGVEKLIAQAAQATIQSTDPSRTIQVLLPLSPNHGQFGYDGLYAETKAALEVLLEKWFSERAEWAEACSLIGAKIGWVRSTGLMEANDIVAASLEAEHAVRTFSGTEMGFLLTSLLREPLCQEARKAPLVADLTAGMGKVPQLGKALQEIRLRLQNESSILRTSNEKVQRSQSKVLPLNTFDFPQLPSWKKISHLPQAQIDLAKSIVVVGFGEVGTFGNSRLRWEREQNRAFSAQGAIELARMAGWIEFSSSRNYVGWVDAETQEPIAEKEVLSHYQEKLIKSVGIREIESQAGFDPKAMEVYTEVPLEKDLSFQVNDKEMALKYCQANPEKTAYFYNEQSETYQVVLRKGTMIRVPRQEKLTRSISGQIPTGWNASRLGLPREMAEQIDRNTRFNLVGTSEAFLASGLEPEELYQHIHPCRVGNTQGSGMGGMQSMEQLYRHYVLDQPRPNDHLQETLVNVMGAHAVQSYIGSYGPTISPADACASAAVSVEVAMEKILAGKADFMVTGGYDDLGDAGMGGFSDMSATANSDEMKKQGFGVEQICRPNDSRRSGFVEAQGGGSVLLCRGDLAIQMGLPIYGVVAMAHSASDGINNSIPAPGLGLLSVGAENKMSGPSPLRQALADYGLTVDDIAVVSKHDTSTQANDINESELYHRLMEHLGRKESSPLLTISQKSITGHCKGGSAAWQLSGLLQAMESGVIPGNPNLDDVDERLSSFSQLVFSDQTLEVGPGKIAAGLLTSLGFGHVGAMLCLVHPERLYTRLSEEEYQKYQEKQQKRWIRRYQREHRILIGQENLVQVRQEKPFAKNGKLAREKEIEMLLAPKVTYDFEEKVFSVVPPVVNPVDSSVEEPTSGQTSPQSYVGK